MADVHGSSGLSLAEIAALTGAVPRAGVPLAHRITNIAAIDHAGPADLTYVDNVRFAGALATTGAGAVLTTERFQDRAPAALNLLIARAPHRAFVTVARELHRDVLRPLSPYEADSVMPGACVHPTASLGEGVTVDPGAVVGPRAQVGAGTVIAANAVIGADVRIGRECSIGPATTIAHARVGDRVIIHPGCHIGQDGFGYVPGPKGHDKVPQIGRVVIHDDVEIGAGTTIDRGGIRDTVIGQGTKIDNLVQIGHNVVIGRHCIIVAQSGLSGSVTLEDKVVLAARVGVHPQVTIHEGAQLGARSTVLRDVPPGVRWTGAPNAKPIRQFHREMVALEKLGQAGGKVASPPISDDAAQQVDQADEVK